MVDLRCAYDTFKTSLTPMRLNNTVLWTALCALALIAVPLVAKDKSAPGSPAAAPTECHCKPDSCKCEKKGVCKCPTTCTCDKCKALRDKAAGKTAAPTAPAAPATTGAPAATSQVSDHCGKCGDSPEKKDGDKPDCCPKEDPAK